MTSKKTCVLLVLACSVYLKASDNTDPKLVLEFEQGKATQLMYNSSKITLEPGSTIELTYPKQRDVVATLKLAQTLENLTKIIKPTQSVPFLKGKRSLGHLTCNCACKVSNIDIVDINTSVVKFSDNATLEIHDDALKTMAYSGQRWMSGRALLALAENPK